MDEDLDFDLSDVDSADDISIDVDIALPDETTEPDVDSRPLCHFFAKGACRNGDECKFKHEDGETANAPRTNIRVYKGIKVTFGPGAEVTGLKLPFDHVVKNSAEARVSDGLGYYAGIGEGAVVCAWYKDSKTAKIFYAKDKRSDARWAERRLRGQILRGRKIRVTYRDSMVKRVNKKAATDKGRMEKSQRNERTVFITGLPPDATQEDLLDLLGPQHKFAAIQIGKGSGLDDQQRMLRAKKDLMDCSRWYTHDNGWDPQPLLRFEPLPDSDPQMVRYAVEFSDPSVTRKMLFRGRVVRVVGARVPPDPRGLRHDRDGSKLPGGIFVYARVTLKFKVLSHILQAIQAEFNALAISSWEEKKVHIRSYESSEPPEKFRNVRIYGQDPEAVFTVKGAFEELLAGTTAMDGDSILWDDFFVTQEGLRYLQHLYANRVLYIFRDNRRCRLVLYGTLAAKTAAEEQLIEKLKDVKGYSHVMRMNEEEFKAAVGGGLEEVIDNFGKDTVSLNVVGETKSLTVYGTDQDFKTIRKIIRSQIGLFDEDMDVNAVCPACYTTPEDPVTTPCGHTYCTDCFVHQCSTDIPDIPITCYGNEANCNKQLPLYALEAALPASNFESLLYNSYLCYVRGHPLALTYCPTPDCPTIFRRTTDGSVLPCHNCSCRICTTCQAVEHAELSCEEATDAATGGHRMFKKWKEENGTRDCPKCGMVCDLFDGCSQVQCLSCKTFFCWTCGLVGEDGNAVHKHLVEVHGSYFPGREEYGEFFPDNEEEEREEA